MSTILDGAVGVVLTILDALRFALAPVDGGAAAAAAVVLLTVAVRLALVPLALRRATAERARSALAPQVKALTDRHRRDPVRLNTELSALYRSEGVPSPARGLLPALLQIPVFMVLYSAFRQATVDGHRNTLLSEQLFGVSLGAHGPAAGWLLVALLAGLAAVATVSARRMRAGGSPSWLTLTPYLTLVPVLFTPVAAGIYLLTSTAWSAGEAAVLRLTT